MRRVIQHQLVLLLLLRFALAGHTASSYDHLYFFVFFTYLLRLSSIIFHDLVLICMGCYCSGPVNIFTFSLAQALGGSVSFGALTAQIGILEARRCAQ